MGAVAALPNDGSRSAVVTAAAAAAPTTQHQRIVYEYQRMIYYAKSPHSWALPPNWNHICDSFPTIIRNKVTGSATNTKGLLAGNRRDAFAMRTTSLTASLERTN